ncbi:MAG: hypothetical protein IPG89_09950 [Bacteroidetes bacterium]|nr:hypothetical protein [Bacteroidota bacterium]
MQTGHNGSLKQIAFSFDDQYIASIDDGTRLFFRILKTEKEFADLKENFHTVNSLCFHPNLPLLVSGGSDSTVLVWDYLNSKIVDKIKFSSGAVTSVMFSSDGSKLLVCANSLNELNFSDKQITFSKKDFFYQKAYFSDLGVLFSVGNGEKNFYASFNKVNNSNSTNTILKRRAFAPFRDGTLNFYSLGSKGNELTEYKLSSKNNLYYKNSKITEGSDKFKIIAIESSKKVRDCVYKAKNILFIKLQGLKKHLI